MTATLADIEEGMATLAWLMRSYGEQGLGALPVFERLEREREKLLDIDRRLDAALARARTPRQRSGARRGRPPQAHPKEAVKLWLDADVLAAFRATGEDWETRMNAALRKAAGL